MIRVSVPATSANCCTGFDTMGAALDWRGEFLFEPAETFSITGCPEAFQTKDNLVYQAFSAMCARLEKEVPTMHIHISCDVPLARGLGSSSCCVVAGLAAANAWFGSPLSKEELLEEAVKLEGHPDNAAPAIFGGLCICIPQLFRFSVKGWHVAALIPNTQVSTNEARKLLPASLSLHEAALQAGRNALVVQGLLSGDLPMLQTASEDMLHEPYRSRLIPEYEAAKAFYQDKAVLWISGSGSTMLVLSKDEIEKFPGVETRFLSFDDEGVKVDDE